MSREFAEESLVPFSLSLDRVVVLTVHSHVPPHLPRSRRRLPVMLAARKLNGEDPNVIFNLRCLYGFVQAVAVALVLFIYLKASAAAKDSTNAVKIYVPAPPQVGFVEFCTNP